MAGLLVLFLCLGLTGCHSSSDEADSNSSRELNDATAIDLVLPIPVVPESSYHNTTSSAHLVGRMRCAECHAAQAAAFLKTRHAESMSLPTGLQLPDTELIHEQSGYRYTTRTENGREIHSEAMRIEGADYPTAEYPVEFVVGSGQFGHSFLLKPDQFYVQSPLTWYSTRKCWDLSPGYDAKDQFSFRRVVSARCLYCHSGNVEVRNNNEFDFVVHETAISCERCHGPGSIHSADRAGGKAPAQPGEADYSIVNPRRLSRELSEAICQQCHLQGDAQIPVRGQQFDSFRPGQALASFRQDYRIGRSAQMTIVGHVEQMHSSPCYQKSDTLTCITCHKPHHNVTAEQLPNHYRQACLSCHTEDSCHETAETRHSVARDRCVQCHMPAAPTEVPHVAFTHHRIGLHKPTDVSDETQPMTLHAMLPPPPGATDADLARTEGLAWLHVALSKSGPDFQIALRSAREQLTVAWDSGARDAAVAAGLARIATEIAWPEQAELWANRARDLESGPSDPSMNALTILSELHFERNENREALDGFRTLTELRRDARHWFFRGLAEQNLGTSADAVQSLEQSLILNPRNPGAHAALAAIYQVLKNDDKAAYHRQMSARLAAER